LIERTTRSIQPTLAAREFRDRAAAMLAEAEEAIAALTDATDRFAHQRNAMVTVAAIPTATHHLLPEAMTRFRQSGFQGRIRILDLSADAVLNAVAAGEADFGINFIGGQEPGLDFHVLADDPFVLAMPVGDPLASQETIQWTDIDPTRFIAVWKGSGNRMLIDAALARSRISLAWAYEVRHLSTALSLVEAGLGVTALPASAMPGADHPLVTARPLTNPDITRAVGTVRRTQARLSATAEAFYEMVLDRWSGAKLED
jgi:DNA-binding transcriptional LysR family regulator